MKNARNWTKTMGVVALGVMIMAPAASYAVDLSLPETQTRLEARTLEEERYASTERYMERERKMEKKTSEAHAQKRNQKRERIEASEDDYGASNHERQQVRSGSYGGGGGGHGRGR